MAEDSVLESSKTDGAGAKGEDTVYTSKLEWASVKRVFGIRTNQFIFAQALPGSCV